MAQIHVLDSETVDKIAAGEVVERPASVVKELVENAIDAGASAITVEVKEGGIEFSRVTDNGMGMEREQLRKAFLRHATSKIESAEDLSRVSSLGFRGEALSSIAAVSKVEVITKPKNSLTGTRIVLEGAVEKSFEEIGAPEGTTFIMRNLFYNTPVRRKFLKQPATEGGYITDLMEHLALSRPDISFKFLLGNQTRFHTSGNGDLKEVIYRIYGREIAASVIPVQTENGGIKIEGYLGKPMLVRSNRNFEIYYINGRFIKSNVVARAIEEGYKEYLMQHKFPLCVLHITMDTERVDVNVHPTKMDVRFSDGMCVSSLLSLSVRNALKQREMIPEAVLGEEKGAQKKERQLRHEAGKEHTPEPFEQHRSSHYRVAEQVKYRTEETKMQDFMQNPVWNRVLGSEKQREMTGLPSKTSENSGLRQEATVNKREQPEQEEEFFVEAPEDIALSEQKGTPAAAETLSQESVKNAGGQSKPQKDRQKEFMQEQPEIPTQMNLFREKMLTVENRVRYRIIGQVFDTYWLIQFEDKLFMIDQHAAHEKVKYERLMKQYREKNVACQILMPPIIVSLSGQEEQVLKEYQEIFVKLGFEVEVFGGSEYALRSVPVDLYGCSEREMFLEVLDELSEGISRNSPRVVEEKIASMSCKAAVKGNNCLSFEEAEKLIDELLTLENPYNCPHGRPTIITISKAEMEKKFKRIV